MVGSLPETAHGSAEAGDRRAWKQNGPVGVCATKRLRGAVAMRPRAYEVVSGPQTVKR